MMRKQALQQRQQVRQLCWIGHEPGTLPIAIRPAADCDDAILADVQTDGQRLAGATLAQLVSVHAIDNRASVCFALHGDDLLYAGWQRPALPLTPLLRHPLHLSMAALRQLLCYRL